ncbi:MAG: hypothetical protein A4S12_06930 [Proteobacteria bacterium SG_bin5]|nr:MAG: hypothetical protein A4S12_06930 [Proteobacteria bacterium SG_bin5]
MSRDDVARRFSTVPRWSEIERADWLARIEEDIEPVTLRVAGLLIELFPINPATLAELSVADASSRRPRNIRAVRTDNFDVSAEIAAACIAALPPRRTAEVIDLAAARARTPEGPAA